MNKTKYRDDIYRYECDDGYVFKQDGINLGTVIYDTKLSKTITMEKYEINIDKNSE